MIDFLNQGWVSLTVGLVVAAIAFFAARRRADPKATIQAFHELTWNKSHQLPVGFELKFRNKTIPCISRGIFRFWNAGSETLSHDLVPQHDRLRLVIPDGEFLAAVIARESNNVNRFKVEIDSKNSRVVNVSFDFLDPSEGATVGFLHSSSTATPILSGTIKGHKIKIIDHSVTGEKNPGISRIKRHLSRTLPIPIIAAGFFLLGITAIPAQYITSLRSAIKWNESFSTSQAKEPIATLYLAVGGASYILLGGAILWRRRRKHPKSLDWPKATDNRAE